MSSGDSDERTISASHTQQSTEMAAACSCSLSCTLCQCSPAALPSSPSPPQFNSSPHVSTSSCPTSPLMELTMDAHKTAFGDLHSRRRRARSREESGSRMRGSASASTSPLFSSSLSRGAFNGSNSNSSGGTSCTHSSSTVSLDPFWLPQPWNSTTEGSEGREGGGKDEGEEGDGAGNVSSLARRLRSISLQSVSASSDDPATADSTRARRNLGFRRTQSFHIEGSSSGPSSRRVRGKSSALSAKQRQFMRCACGKRWDDATGDSNNGNDAWPAASAGTSAATLPLSSPNHHHSSSINEGSLDIEDITAQSEEQVRDLTAQLVEASPRLVVQVNGNAESVRGDRCSQCNRGDCMLVTGRKGFYFPAQIASHCTPDDCWVSANGFVYDVTRYLSKHPGGAQSILRRAGGDATEDFKFHSKMARERIWRRYRIGRVAYCDGPKSNSENCTIS